MGDELKKQPWLIIFDGVDSYDSIASILPYFQSHSTQQHLLITSRDDDWRHENRIDVDVYTREQSIDYIKSQMEDTGSWSFNDAQAYLLAEQLGDHPLALELAMANIDSRKYTLSDYIEKLSKKGISSEPWPKKKSPYQTRFNTNTLPKLWDLASEDLEVDTVLALNAMSFIDNEAIQRVLLLNLFDNDSERYLDAVQPLWARSLVKRHEVKGEKEWFSIHKLIQEVVREQVITQWKNLQLTSDAESLRFFVAKLSDACEVTFFTPKHGIQDVSLLQYGTKHAYRWLQNMKNLATISGDTKVIISSKMALACLWTIRGEKYFDRIYGILPVLDELELLLQSSLSSEDQKFFSIAFYNEKGNFRSSQGNYEDARLYLINALSQFHDEEKCQDLNAETHTYLGDLYHLDGKFSDARTEYLFALNIYQKHHGENWRHVWIPTIRRKLSELYQSDNRFYEAKNELDRCLALQKTIYGESGHPDIANTHIALATFFISSDDDYIAAQDEYRKALLICKAVNQKWFSFSISLIQFELAKIDAYIGNTEKAQGRFEEYLTIEQSIYGKSDHPAIANTLNIMAKIHRKKGEYEEARRKHEQALQLLQRIHSFNQCHPSIIATHIFLGDLDKEENNINGARTQYRLAYSMAESMKYHAGIIGALSREADLLFKEEKFLEAIGMYQTLLAIQQGVYAEIPAHPHMAETWHSMGLIYFEQETYGQAYDCFEKALSMNREFFQETVNRHVLPVYCMLVQTCYLWEKTLLNEEYEKRSDLLERTMQYLGETFDEFNNLPMKQKVFYYKSMEPVREMLSKLLKPRPEDQLTKDLKISLFSSIQTLFKEKSKFVFKENDKQKITVECIKFPECADGRQRLGETVALLKNWAAANLCISQSYFSIERTNDCQLIIQGSENSIQEVYTTFSNLSEIHYHHMNQIMEEPMDNLACRMS